MDVLKAVVEKGADVNAANDLGMTPLHYAARGNERILEYLAKSGAKFDARNKQGRTPVELAKGRTAALVAKLTGAATSQR